MSGQGGPPQPQANPFIPGGVEPIVFEGFDTLNTLAARPSIEDTHCSWMDGFMPIGKSTARTMPGLGPAIFNAPGSPVVWFGFASVGLTPYCIVITLDGSVWAVNTQTNAAALIAATLINSASESNVGIAQWGNQYIIIVASSQISGNGYWLWDGTTFYFPGDSVPNFDTVPTGIQGSSVETYTSRVWVANGASIYFSAPQSITDFATMDGGGAFTSSDSFLRLIYERLVQSSGFLYLIADSSMNYISQVKTAGSPPTTTFSNQNADPEIGTPYQNTVQVLSRSIMFANAFGVHRSDGGVITKVSDLVDGLWDSVPGFAGLLLSSCKAIVFGRRIYCTLVPAINVTSGQIENYLVCTDSTTKRWWTCRQDVPMTFVSHQEVNSVITAFGTNGTSIWPMFQTPTAAVQKVIQSKLFPGQGGLLLQKAATRLWGAVIYNSSVAPDLALTIDSEVSRAPQGVVLQPSPTEWINSASDDLDIAWHNSALAGDVTWNGAGTGIVVFPPSAIAQNGTMLGLTLYTQAADMILLQMIMGPTVTQYRG